MNLTAYSFTLVDDDVLPSIGLAAGSPPAADNICQMILDKILKNTAFSVNPVWISLHTAAPGLTGGHEVSGGSYSRIEADGSGWSTPSAGSIHNTAAIEFGSMPICTVAWAGIWSSGSGGTFIRGVELNYPLTLKAGDAPKFPISALTVGMSSDFSTYLANKLLAYLFKGSAFTTATTHWALHTGAKDDTGGHEAVGGSYARQNANIGDWTATGESLLGDTVFSLDYQALVQFTGMPATTITRLALWDSGSGGNFLMWAPERSLAVAGGETVSIDGTIPRTLSATLTQIPFAV